MIRSLIRLVIFLVIGVLVYNFFLGTPEEKETSRKIWTEVKEVGVAVKDLIKSEKEKFDEGKYDNALEKIGNVFTDLKIKAEGIHSKYLRRIDKLDEKRQNLERRLSELEEEKVQRPEEYNRKSKREERKLNQELEKLVRETEDIIQEMEYSVEKKEDKN